MPANKKPASSAPAKTAKKDAVSTASTKPVKDAKPEPETAPVKKAAAKSETNPSPPVKKAPAKTATKAAAKKAPAKEAPAKKAAAKAEPAETTEEVPVKKAAPAKKEAAKKADAPEKKVAVPKAEKAEKVEKAAAKPKAAAPTPKITNVRRTGRIEDEGITMDAPPKKPVLPLPFLKKQRQRLAELRDAYLNSAEGVTAENLRGGEGGDSSAFGMHQADAGSDAYDRDFALSLLAKEQDAIYEINEALKRIDYGTYGICEMSGETISEERLEALPFTRFTVVCQERIEREEQSGRWNRPVRSLFGLDESADDADDDRDEEETSGSSNSNSNESLDFSKE